MDEVFAGAGSSGGLFYQLAHEYRESLFDILAIDQKRAAHVVTRLKQKLKQWRDGAPSRSLTVKDIREAVLSDSQISVVAPELAGVSWDRFENYGLQIRECCQHRDLHGLNVLVEGDEPVLIDFGEVDTAAACFDPITLELSLIFHPSSENIRGEWPTAMQAEKWYDLDLYINGCPVPNFVRNCREWALEAKFGNRELYANVYAYCARQLKYAETNHSLALALIRGVIEAFERT
jgi:hypothetical protein